MPGDAGTGADANQGAGAIRTAVDAGALEGWLTANVPDYAGPLTIDQFNGGQSNPTYRLTTPLCAAAQATGRYLEGRA